MRVAVGNDHAGYPSKDIVLDTLREMQMEFDYCGSDSVESVDFPDITASVCSRLLSGQAERGILICGTGVGASIAANKTAGIRAVVGHDLFSARQGVEHDNANVLCLGAWIVGSEMIRLAIREFLQARFSTNPDFRRRVMKLDMADRMRVKGLSELDDADQKITR